MNPVWAGRALRMPSTDGWLTRPARADRSLHPRATWPWVAVLALFVAGGPAHAGPSKSYNGQAATAPAPPKDAVAEGTFSGLGRDLVGQRWPIPKKAGQPDPKAISLAPPPKAASEVVSAPIAPAEPEKDTTN